MSEPVTRNMLEAVFCLKLSKPMSHNLWEAMFRVFVHVSSDNEVVYY